MTENDTDAYKNSMSGKSLINPALRAVAHLRSSALPKNVTKSAAAFLSAAPSGGAHTLPDLPYNYDALERKCAHASVFLVAERKSKGCSSRGL